MKGSLKLAKRYARALLELYQPNVLEGVRESLKELSKFWESDQEFPNAMLNPAFPLSDRTACVRALAARVRKDDQSFANFLAVLLDAGRISLIPLISETFSQMIDELKNLLALEITSANPVNSDEVEQLKNKVEKDFGSLATIEWGVDQDLIGGMRIRSGDKLLDGSIRGRLERLQASLGG